MLISIQMSTKLVLLITLFLNFIFIVIGILIGNPIEQYFSKEASYITWVSFFQLLIIANLSLQIYKSVKNKQVKQLWKSPALLWGIIALGFLYLAVDEVIRIHENLDNIIHRVFHLKKTAITDRLDDAIIGFYGLVGVGVLYYFRSELKKYKKSFPLFLIGFVLLFLMVIIDMSNNNIDVIKMLVSDHNLRHTVFSISKVLEDSLKLIAESFFIGAFYFCFKSSKSALNP